MTTEVTYERRIALIAATSCVGHGVDLDRRIGQLSTLRNAYSLLHEVAHHRLAYNEANETGMVAFAEAFQYLQDLQDLTWSLPADWPTDFPVAIALPVRNIKSARSEPPRVTFRLPIGAGSLLADSWAAMVRFIDSLLGALRLIRLLVCTILARRSDALAFVLLILAVCRHYGRRGEPDDHTSLPVRRYLTSMGSCPQT